MSACGSACVDLESDSENCGACGHDCLGGDCTAAECQPSIVASAGEYGYIGELTVSGEYAYWLNGNGGVSRRRVDGSDTVKVLVTGEDSGLSGLAVSASQLLWSVYPYVRACSLPSCEQGAQDALPSFSRANFAHFAAPSKTLFWSAATTDFKANGLKASRIPNSAVDIGSATADTVAIASDQSYVYWADQSSTSGDTINADGNVWRAKLSNLVPLPLATGLTGRGGQIAVAGGALYFAGQYDTKGAKGTINAIFRIPLPDGIGAGALTPFAEVSQWTAPSVNGLVADQTAAYWIDGKLGVIDRCSLSSCGSPKVVATAFQNAVRLQQDSTAIYWIGQQVVTPKIFRLAK